MKITPCGAAGEVTGSCYVLETERAKILIDCGLFQGHRVAPQKNREALPVPAEELDAVVLTHAHIDHAGRLPVLGKLGFQGTVRGTPATLDLVELLLYDSAHIQEQELARINRRRQRRGRSQLQPLYGHEDVEAILQRVEPLRYDQAEEVAPGIEVRLVEAGHILGSTSAVVTAHEGGVERTLVFSGDLGPYDSPILRDPARLEHADMVFIESTYGHREHRPLDETVEEFEAILVEAVERRHKLLVPAFAVGRTQQIFFHIAEAIRKGLIPKFPLWLDSPMASKATAIYSEHRYLFDAESKRLVHKEQFQKDLSELRISVTPDDSRALNDLDGPCLIVAGSGMCNGGRILHHLRHNLPSPRTAVLIVGYQVGGTLGSRLVAGAEEVRMFGREIPVRARVHTLGGFSAHAGQKGLLRWFSSLAPASPRVAVMHGEPESRAGLGRALAERFGVAPLYPERLEPIEL